VVKQVRRGPHSGSESLVLRLSEAFPFPFPLRGALALLCGALAISFRGQLPVLLGGVLPVLLGGPLSFEFCSAISFPLCGALLLPACGALPFRGVAVPLRAVVRPQRVVRLYGAVRACRSVVLRGAVRLHAAVVDTRARHGPRGGQARQRRCVVKRV
jgi:hypothetical protein